jgi:hypothetical protein
MGSFRPQGNLVKVKNIKVNVDSFSPAKTPKKYFWIILSKSTLNEAKNDHQICLNSTAK